MTPELKAFKERSEASRKAGRMTPERKSELLELQGKEKALFLDVAFWRAAAMKEAKQAKRDVRFWQGHYLVMVIFAFALVLWIGFA